MERADSGKDTWQPTHSFLKHCRGDLTWPNIKRTATGTFLSGQTDPCMSSKTKQALVHLGAKIRSVASFQTNKIAIPKQQKSKGGLLPQTRALISLLRLTKGEPRRRQLTGVTCHMEPTYPKGGHTTKNLTAVSGVLVPRECRCLTKMRVFISLGAVGEF